MAFHVKHYVICPHCNKNTNHSVDHLLTMKWIATVWSCNHCGGRIAVAVDGDMIDDIKITKAQGKDPRRRALSLLKYERTAPLYFVIDQNYLSGPDEGNEREQELAAFYFESHSCPTNWLRETRKLIYEGDDDPHGAIEFVRRVYVERDFDADNADIKSIFPDIKF